MIKSLKNQKRSETYVSDPVGMEFMFTLWHSPLHGKSAKHHSYTETGLCSSTGTSVWMARSKAKLRWAKAPVQSKHYHLPTWFPQNKLGHRIATTHTTHNCLANPGGKFYFGVLFYLVLAKQMGQKHPVPVT